MVVLVKVHSETIALKHVHIGINNDIFLFVGLVNLSFNHLLAHAVKSVIVMFVLYPTHVLGIPEVSDHPNQHYKPIVNFSKDFGP